MKTTSGFHLKNIYSTSGFHLKNIYSTIGFHLKSIYSNSGFHLNRNLDFYQILPEYLGNGLQSLYLTFNQLKFLFII